MARIGDTQFVGARLGSQGLGNLLRRDYGTTVEVSCHQEQGAADSAQPLQRRTLVGKKLF
jgi:hypothetical protein